MDRDFTATGRDKLWVADITFVPTANGFMYLAVVLDAWSRKIVGFQRTLNQFGAQMVRHRPRGIPPIRLRLPKIAVRVRETASRIQLAFAANCPEAALLRNLVRALFPRPT